MLLPISAEAQATCVQTLRWQDSGCDAAPFRFIYCTMAARDEALGYQFDTFPLRKPSNVVVSGLRGCASVGVLCCPSPTPPSPARRATGWRMGGGGGRAGGGVWTPHGMRLSLEMMVSDAKRASSRTWRLGHVTHGLLGTGADEAWRARPPCIAVVKLSYVANVGVARCEAGFLSCRFCLRQLRRKAAAGNLPGGSLVIGIAADKPAAMAEASGFHGHTRSEWHPGGVLFVAIVDETPSALDFASRFPRRLDRGAVYKRVRTGSANACDDFALCTE